VQNSERVADGTGFQRNTRQRAVIQASVSSGHDFRTAGQIHDELKRDGDKIGLSTVYRALQTMADSGELDSIRTPDGETAYRRCSDGHHHHLVCRVCGHTEEVWGPTFEQWADRVAAEHGYTEVRHDLEIFGRCADCTVAGRT
jgi:Fur family ferric uptake transcriptional regulator